MSRFFEIYEDGEEHRFLEEDLPLVIGRDREAHVHLDRGPARQATIDLHEGRYLYLAPAQGAGDIFHNDQLIRERVWIKSGDRTRIGKWVITYRISGDRVEIVRSPYTGPETPGPVSAAALEPNGTLGGSPLPVAEEEPVAPRSRLKRNLVAGLAFFLLLLAAVFVLTARSVEVKVEPQPDRVSLHGRLPLLHFGNRYIGVAGTYRLEASREGFQDLAADVAIGASEPDRYSFTMERLPGLLSVSGTPEGAQVLLDGEPLGKLPLAETEVSSGPHELVCRAEHYLDQVQKIDLPAGTPWPAECHLAPAIGRVFVVTDPPGAAVLENGGKLGTAPLTLELEPGKHSLVLELAGYQPQTMEVTLTGGETLTPEVVTLARAPVKVGIFSTPKGALVSSGGRELGKTPLTVSWPRGSRHTLLFSRAGYENVVREVAVTEEKEQKITVTLPPEPATVLIKVTPADARLYIDGNRQKKSSGEFRLSTRPHRVEARAPGHVTLRREITPEKKQRLELNLVLEPEAAPRVPPASSPAPAQPAVKNNPGQSITEKPTPARPVKSGVPVKGETAMVRLGPGRFTMGASRRDPGRRANETRHEVEITRPFLLAVHEVTNEEYHRFKPEHRAGVIAGVSLDGDRQPVVKVSWEDAARYCNWLSRREGVEPFYREQGNTLVADSPTGTGYRLPFEAEWAFAARMVGRTRPGRYPWNGDFPPRRRSGNYADESARTIVPVVISGYYDGFPVTAPVESFPRNMGGLFDMGGNVSEWCHDFYSPSLAATGVVRDPIGPATGRFHVFRGSSWRDGAMTELRLSYRGYADSPRDSLGFRVARYEK